MRTVTTFTVQIQVQSDSDTPDAEKRMLADLPAMMEAFEEDLTDLLPIGFRARVREWDDIDPEQEADHAVDE